VKWQVFRHVTECNTNKLNTINVSVFRTLGGGLWLWFPGYHPESTFTGLTPYKRMFFSISPHTCTLCPMFSLDPTVVGLAPPCTWWRKDAITQLCASHTFVTWSAKSLSFFSFLYMKFGEELVLFSFLYMKLFELGVEVAFNNWSAFIHHKVNLLKFPLWSSSFEHIDDAFFAAHLLSALMSASSFVGSPQCAFTSLATSLLLLLFFVEALWLLAIKCLHLALLLLYLSCLRLSVFLQLSVAPSCRTKKHGGCHRGAA